MSDRRRLPDAPRAVGAPDLARCRRARIARVAVAVAVAVGACALALAWLARGRTPDTAASRESEAAPASAGAARAPAATESTSVPAAHRERVAARVEQLVVQVVDRSGQPRAGVGIALAWVQRGTTGSVLYDVGVTEGAEGICRLAALREVIARQRVHYMDHVHGVTIRGVTAEIVPFDIDHLPAETVRLVLPATGSVVVRLVDAAGGLLRQRTSVTLEAHERDAAMVRSMDGHGFGRVRFAAVTLRAGLVVRCDCPGAGRLPEQRLEGPQHDGEEVEVTFRVADGLPILTGTVVTADGRPEAIPSMRAHVTVPRLRSWYADCSTGEDGRLRIALDEGMAGGRVSWVILEEISERRQTTRCAMVRLDRTLHAGVQDLGRLTLGTPPLVAGIDVVDAAGAAVDHVEVEVGMPRDGRLDHAALATGQPRLWHRWAGPGRHEFYGETAQDDLIVFVRHPDYLTRDDIPVRRGTQDLRVVLVKGGSVAATVVVDDAIAPLVQLRRADGTLVDLAQPKRHPTPQEEFGWTGLVPGAYSLAVTLPEEAEPMLVLAGLRVEGGKPCDDPRLAALDLRTRVRRVTLTVTAEDGKPLARTDVMVVPLTNQDRRREFVAGTDERGQRVVLLSNPSLDVVVGARGHRARVLRALDRDLTIALAPGIPAAIRLAPISIADGVHVFCSAVKVDAPWRRDVPASSRHRPADVVALLFPEPGSYDLTYRLTTGQKAERLTTRRIEVLDQQEPQRFEVACNAAELAPALATLGK